MLILPHEAKYAGVILPLDEHDWLKWCNIQVSYLEQFLESTG